jgi:hypothetical protein
MKKAKDVFMYVLGAIVVVGVLTLIAMVMIYRPEMDDVINISVGALLAAFGSVVGYFYGSSKGSSDKDHLLMGAAPPVYGCMNKGAINYNPDATMDDGSCIFAAPEKPEG